MVVACLLLAGCSSGGPPTDPDLLFDELPAALLDAGTARVSMRVAAPLVAPSESAVAPSAAPVMQLTGQGVLRFDGQRSRTELDLGDQLDETEIVVTGRDVYVRGGLMELAGVDTPRWVHVDGEVLERQGGGAVEEFLRQQSGGGVLAAAELLRDGAVAAEVVGTDDVRGVATTHYRVRIDTSQAIAGLSTQAQRDADTVEGLPDAFDFEVWLGADGLPYRLQARTGALGLEGGRTTYELHDYGLDLDIEAPPEDRTIDFLQLVAENRG